jgi:hypothetical protein
MLFRKYQGTMFVKGIFDDGPFIRAHMRDLDVRDSRAQRSFQWGDGDHGVNLLDDESDDAHHSR